MSQDLAKEAAAHEAVTLIKSNMTVGLGSGSTASLFIRYLGKKCAEGLKIQAVASSMNSHRLAIEVGIPLLDIQKAAKLDIAVDGADEVDSKKQLIKGAGGALLREKILAAMSQEMVVIVDEKKVVDSIGSFPLPVEILPFGYLATLSHIEKLGFKGKMREKDGSLYVTDNQNYIYDIDLGGPCANPQKILDSLKQIPGVIEVGLFLNIAGRIIVGSPDGKIQILQ